MIFLYTLPVQFNATLNLLPKSIFSKGSMPHYPLKLRKFHDINCIKSELFPVPSWLGDQALMGCSTDCTCSPPPSPPWTHTDTHVHTHLHTELPALFASSFFSFSFLLLKYFPGPISTNADFTYPASSLSSNLLPVAPCLQTFSIDMKITALSSRKCTYLIVHCIVNCFRCA